MCMHKIILSLLIFCDVTINGMFFLNKGRTWGIIYKKGANRNVTFDCIPSELIGYLMFPSDDQPNEIATLFKKYNHKIKSKKKLLDLMLKDIRCLISLSQTSRYFYEQLNKEIERRTTLPYVSHDSIGLCFDDNKEDKSKLFSNNKMFYDVVMLKYRVALYIDLVVDKEYHTDFELYNKEQYNALYSECDRIKKQFNSSFINNECFILQKECEARGIISRVLIKKVKNFLRFNKYDDDFKKFRDCLKYRKSVHRSSYSLTMYVEDNNIAKDIRTSFLTMPNLSSEGTVIHIDQQSDKERNLLYGVSVTPSMECTLSYAPPLMAIVRKYNPFLNLNNKELKCLSAHCVYLNKAEKVLYHPSQNDHILRLTVPVGFTNEPKIPVDLII